MAVGGEGDEAWAPVLEGARRGESWAFERIFGALAPSVARYARAHGSSEPDDLTSEVFLHVFVGLDRFSGSWTGFRSWVFTITHRRLVDERRRATRRPRTSDEAVEVAAADEVETLALAELGTERVRALCERLVPGQRDVLLLRLVADLTVEQAAEVMDRTPGAVKQLQRRGLLAVRRMLAAERVPL